MVSTEGLAIVPAFEAEKVSAPRVAHGPRGFYNPNNFIFLYRVESLRIRDRVCVNNFELGSLALF